MATKRWTIAAGLLLLAGFAGGTQIYGRRLSNEETFIREFPDALIYQGVGLYRQGDFRGAAEAWEQYLKIAPKGADTVSVREMIDEANRARK